MAGNTILMILKVLIHCLLVICYIYTYFKIYLLTLSACMDFIQVDKPVIANQFVSDPRGNQLMIFMMVGNESRLRTIHK